MSYGLFQGLNEAYDSFRAREADIEAKDDRQAARERAAVTQEREDEQYGIQVEQQAYDRGKRPMQERLQKTQVESAELQQQQAEDERGEWLNNADSRKRLNQQALDKSRLDLDNAGITYNMNRVAERATLGAEKYRKWKTEFMHGGTVDQLVKNYNGDDDKTNDILNVDPKGDGWVVNFKNGRTEEFADRNAIAEHLEFMADPDFHQTWLLQQRASDAALAKAIVASNSKDNEFWRKEKNSWNDDTISNTDRLYGKIQQGLVDFGEPGARKVAGAVRQLVDNVGNRASYSGVVNSSVSSTVGLLADQMLELDEKVLRNRAKETFEKLPNDPKYFDPARFPNGKPDEDDPEYEIAMRELVFRDMDEQVKNLEIEVYKHYFRQNPDTGAISTNDDADSKGTGGNQITDKGLTDDKPADDKPAMGLTPPPVRYRDDPSVPPQLQSANQTPQQLVADKRTQYGLSQSTARKSIPKSKKRKIAKDFDAEFASWPKNRQGAWFKAFGLYLDKTRQETARGLLKGKTSTT